MAGPMSLFPSRLARVCIALFATLPGVALAQQASRDLCADRPGLGTPACTVEPGRIVFELGLADWTREHDGDKRTDTILAGDMLVRIGLAGHLEAQVGWTGYGDVRTREPLTAMVERRDGIGDVTLALRRNLSNPDGSGLSIAIMPFATLPVGNSAIGAGDWGAGLLLPIGFDLGSGLSLAFTPEVDAAVDSDGSGRHFAYGSVAGLGFDLSGSLSGTAELSATRDEDEPEHTTQMLASLSFAWQSGDDLQLDIGANLGLNHDSPDRQIHAGIVRRF